MSSTSRSGTDCSIAAKCGAAVVDTRDVVAIGRERALEHPADRPVVLDDENEGAHDGPA